MRSHTAGAFRCGRALGASFVAASSFALFTLSHSTTALGAVAATGNVTPAPPAGGGNVVAPFLVGDTGVGTVTINAGTPLTVNTGSAIIGDDAEAVGIINATGLGSNFSTGNDITIGNLGTGSLVASTLARISTTDDLLLGVTAGASGSLFVDDLGTIVDIGDDVVIGQAGSGLAQLTAGARVLADATTVGQTSGSDGSVTISGRDSLWRQTGALIVGDAGQGTIQVVGQGRMDTNSVIIGNAASGVGVTTINGAGSVWQITGSLVAGQGGRATVAIVDGARVSNAASARLGAAAGSEGTLTVSGVNSLWTPATTLTVGDAGTGTLRVLAGGRVNAGVTTLASAATSQASVIVDGNGSVWDISGTLTFGAGESSLTISNGGLVSATGVVQISATAELSMQGGRLDVAAPLGLTNLGLILGGGRIDGFVTNNAVGEVRVQGGNVLLLGQGLTNAGKINVDNGELEVLGNAANTHDLDARDATLRFQGASGLINNAGGRLAIVGGTVDVYGNVNNSTNGRIIVGGESQAVFHDVVTDTGGQLFVLPGSNVLMLEDLSFSAASLLGVQLGAADAASDSGKIAVAGGATLAGSLEVGLANGYTPTLGDSFEVLSATDGLTGTFAMPVLPSLGSGLAWNVAYSANSLTLSVTTGQGADFDGDGDVDGTDFSRWADGFGAATGADASDGDADADGDVDGSDFLSWQRQYGSTSGGAAVGAAVPEPSAMALTALAALALVARARKS